MESFRIGSGCLWTSLAMAILLHTVPFVMQISGERNFVSILQIRKSKIYFFLPFGFVQVLHRILPQIEKKIDRNLCRSRCTDVTDHQGFFFARFDLFLQFLKIHAAKKK
jgi:TRAP-type C4-dicarboxylate transport system permease small subunit